MTSPKKTSAAGPNLGELTRSYGIVFALVLILIIITILQPGFLAFGNLMNILSQWASIGIMGIGMTYVVITRGFDLAVAATFTLCAVTAAALGQTQPPFIAFTGAILVGVMVGWVNGFVVTGLRVNPFIATLGTSLVIAGIALVITSNSPVIVDNAQFSDLGTGRLWGIPYSGIILIVLMLFAGLMLAYSSYGHMVYATGGNPEASHLVGIPTSLVTASTYAISGGCAGIAGVLSASQLSSATPTVNNNVLFAVLTVVIVGGTSLGGGKGAIWRTAVGVAILATIQNGFNLMDIDPYYQDIIKGLIIIGAIATVDWRRLVTRFKSNRSISTHSSDKASL